MRSWLVIGVLAFAAAQPVPRQKADTQQHQEVSQKAPPRAVVSPVTATKSRPTAPVEKDCPNEKTEAIWQKAFSPESWPNWALVIAGLGAIAIALRTLGTIDRQTTATEVAATAAKANVEALVNSERARVIAELIPVCHRDENKQWYRENGTLLTMEEIILGKHHMHRLRIINLGRTPAHIFNYEVRSGPLVEGDEFSAERLESSRFNNLNTFLASGESRSLEEVSMTDAFAANIKTGAFCVTVKYGDLVTGREQHETSIVYHYRGSDSSLERITVCDKYT